MHMTSTARLSAIAATLALLSACTSTSDITDTKIGHDPIDIEGSTMHHMVQNLRAGYGVQDLQLVAKISGVARDHGRDMARNDYFSHTSQDGRGLADRLEAAGYDACFASENIGYGSLYAEPEEILAAWMNSPGHRKNLTADRPTEYGFAKVPDSDGSHDPIWVMIFADPGC